MKEAIEALKKMMQFLCFPPKLSTLDHIGFVSENYRFWGLINQWGYRTFFSLVRPFWGLLPKAIVYRIFIVPFFIFYMVIKSAVASRSTVRDQTGILSKRRRFFLILNVVFENPGILPEDFLIFNLHLPGNEAYARGCVQNFHISFLIDLASFAQGKHPPHRFSILANNKVKFHDFIRKKKFPAAEIVRHFSKEETRLDDRPVSLPRQDLFLKPVALRLSIGASIVHYDEKACKYQIQEPFEPFPQRLAFDGYPLEPLTEKELVAELTRLGKTLPLMLQPRLRTHRDLVKLCGDEESLVTARIITAKDFHDGCHLLMAFLRLPSQPGGPALPVSGGLAVRIDAASGRLSHATTKYGGSVALHPFTHVRFEGIEVPFAGEAIRDCLKIHEALAQEEGGLVPIVGFDVALCDHGYFFIEANSPCGLYFQKLEKPLLYDEHFQRCLESHLQIVRRCSTIHPDPAIRSSLQG